MSADAGRARPSGWRRRTCTARFSPAAEVPMKGNEAPEAHIPPRTRHRSRACRLDERCDSVHVPSPEPASTSAAGRCSAAGDRLLADTAPAGRCVRPYRGLGGGGLRKHLSGGWGGCSPVGGSAAECPHRTRGAAGPGLGHQAGAGGERPHRRRPTRHRGRHGPWTRCGDLGDRLSATSSGSTRSAHRPQVARRDPGHDERNRRNGRVRHAVCGRREHGPPPTTPLGRCSGLWTN